jgi:hypothetical protein
MFMGTPPTHKRLRLPVVEVFRFCNSLICEVHRYFNPLLYVRQLGIEMPMLDPPQA